MQIYGLPTTLEDAKLIILPVPFDATTSYQPGTHKGPQAVFDASFQVDFVDLSLGYTSEPSVAMIPVDPEVLRWNVEARQHAEKVMEAGGQVEGDKALTVARDRVNEISAKVNQWVSGKTRERLERGQLVGILGGDHSVPFAAIEAHADHFGEFGILHVDAHADLRQAYHGFHFSHASIMRNVVDRIPRVTRLVQVAIRDLCLEELECIEASQRIVTFPDTFLADELFAGRSWGSLAAKIIDALPPKVWLSVDIDGLDPAFCPSTGTPVPGGLSFNQASYLLRRVVESGRQVIGFDLCEVTPSADPNDRMDVIVGARMLYRLGLLTLRSQGRL